MMDRYLSNGEVAMTIGEVTMGDELRPDIDVHSILPSDGRGRGLDWEWIAEQVRENHPAWCEIGIFNPSTATQIRRGRYRWVKPEEFEVATRRTDDEPVQRNRARLFLRWKEPE
jgi:hypothetical protein